jgi:hypothetical protein
MKIHSYGAFVDAQDNYLRMNESIAIKYMHIFYRAVIGKFGKD